MSDIRQALILSLFPPGSSENLIIHVKTYQDIQSSGSNRDAKGTPRYLCLTQKKNHIRLLKVKRNSNGSFSISKTWSLDDVKQIQIIDTHQFSLTLNKTYVWAVERGRDKMVFLAFLIDSCRRSASHMPKLVNIDESRIIRYLADPSAPTMGSTKISLPGSDSDGFLQRSPSPRSSHFPNSPRENSFPPSPTTSSGYNYNSLSMSGRSVRSSTTSENGTRLQNDIDGFLEREVYRNKEQDERDSKRELERKETEQRRLFEEQRRAEEDAQRRAREEAERQAEEQKRAKEHQIQQELQRQAEAQKQFEAKKPAVTQRLATTDERDRQLEQTAQTIQRKMTQHASLMNTEKLMNDYNWKINGNTTSLEKKLLNELHSIDSANLQAAIQSEECIKSIVEHIDRSLEELDNMEHWLSRFETEMNTNQKSVEKV